MIPAAGNEGKILSSDLPNRLADMCNFSIFVVIAGHRIGSP